jgi:serine/threonine protein kinase
VKTPARFHALRNDILPAGARLLQAEDPVAVGGHRLAGRLRSGGAGIVYVAHGRGSGLVTVKTAHPDAAPEHEPVRARLRAEAACARRLPSSCSVRLLDDGTEHTPPYLVSEHVDGPSLEGIVDVQGPLAADLAHALATDLAQALAAVHAAGIMHGDLAPGNILLTKDGVRLLDFGAAEDVPGDPAEIGAAADNPGWLAPELLTGGRPGTACDVFAWGCIVAYAATGHSPYRRITPGEPARFGPLDTSAIEPPLRALVDAAVAEDPAARPSAADLVARLTAPAEPEEEDAPPVPEVTPRRPPRVRARGLVSVLLTLAAVLVAVPTSTEHPAPRPPQATAPAAPPSRPRPTSNAAARALYGRPPVTVHRPRPAAHRPASRGGPPLWMACSSRRPGYCSLPGAPPPPPSGWRLSWGLHD